MMKLALLAALFGSAFSQCNVTLPQVTTTNGVIEGFCIQASPEVNAFLSVPFAEPPVGALRFAKTQPKTNWAGVLSTKTHPPRCIQTGTADPISEDCLYMNVFAPAAGCGGSGCPVIVAFYGGAWNTGGAKGLGDVTLAQTLVSRGLIVVAPQYRTGVLGFGTTGDSNIPGNFGLWDATMALQWVQDNIAAFGGDKDRVTLFGGSAGGTLADCLSLSPSSYNLFNNMIMFSAAARDLFWVNITERTFNLGTSLGLTWTDNADFTAQMRAHNTTGLGAGWLVVTESSYDVLQLTWGPSIDGDFFPTDAQTLRTNAPTKPRLIGTAQLEGAAFSVALTITNNSLPDLLEYMVPVGTPNRTALQDSLFDQYYAVATEMEPNATLKCSIQYAFGERIIVSAVIGIVDRFNEIYGDNQTTFLYVFEHFNPAMVGANYPFISEASHAYDQYFFLGGGPWSYSADDLIVQDLCGTMAYNFAAYNDPNGLGGDALPVYWDKQNSNYPSRHLRVLPEPLMENDDYFGGRPRLNNVLGMAAGSIVV